jgi:asparagine synthase (glutamine-hydrolysing)
MANFLLVVDPDRDRRVQTIDRAFQQVAFLPSLRAEKAVADHYAITWAAAPQAPIERSLAQSPSGGDAILFGEPHDVTGKRVHAEDLRGRQDAEWLRLHELNGYYAALFIHPRHGVRVEADVLGVFPLYHWARGNVLLIATSPALFRCHPEFATALDLHAVAGLLLTSGLVGGRALWGGVRRLPADHLLVRDLGAHVTREIPPPPSAEDSPIENVDEAIDQAADLHESFLRAAVQNCTSLGLQLSGGLDSRLLAGFTTRLNHRAQCITFGRRGDLDARCAIQVATELELPQTLCDVAPEDYTAFAQASVEWEQLSGGLYAIPMGWNIAHRPPPITVDRVVCGLTLDAVIGGPKNVATGSTAVSFDQLRIGRLGFSREKLAALVANPELARACEEVRGDLVEQYIAASPHDHLREWRMNLAHRHRFAVGACAWRYGLYSWPIIPALDRRLIRLSARLPYSVVKDRQVQTRMLITRFPELARLELDRNYLDTLPLIGARRSLIFDARRRLVKLARRSRAALGHDPRFYVRTMNYHCPGWRRIRAAADEARRATHALFKPGVLAELVPPSNVRVRSVGDPIVHSTPLKNTVGLMLWMRQYA